ncbi:MIZ zinc finger protein [Rhizoctonia solani AG-3 Rhs1AP]|uniref:MIZ zinc finger protein n=2 Tax=Rhizoctonia solani AG-3 TaxID=1086053 RepID=A0A074RRW5_9AGAM|nr:MIZ zinc finger protein [Rhizoctonia solani AG-3 Rhs1AP]KEP49796.1 MIZ zinc finger protein [Rhizoctonia solani 123E]
MTEESEIEVLRQTVCLRCPLSQTRIQNPCRFLGCDHFQCFDASSFLLSGLTQAQPNALMLRCPVCDRDVSGEALVIDLYFDDIIKRAPATVGGVYLRTNGEWTIEDSKCLFSRKSA